MTESITAMVARSAASEIKMAPDESAAEWWAGRVADLLAPERQEPGEKLSVLAWLTCTWSLITWSSLFLPHITATGSLESAINIE